MSKVAITKEKLDSLANAVAAKSGIPVLLTVDEMTSAVLGISVGEENVLEGVKLNGTELPIVDKKVNIPAFNINTGRAGIFTSDTAEALYNFIYNNIFDNIPINTSQLYNDSGFITISDVVETDPTVPAWAKASNKPTYTAAEVGALPDSTVIPEDKVFIAKQGTTSYNDVYSALINKKIVFAIGEGIGEKKPLWRASHYGTSGSLNFILFERIYVGAGAGINTMQLDPNNTWTERHYSIPSKTSDLVNDSGYLTSSDLASVLTYKGIKASVANLPTTGNTTGDVWHITADGSEYAWDGSQWQELGTAIDLSGYLLSSDIAAWAKASTKPTYTAVEVGALPDTTSIPTKVSDLTNDSGFISSYIETDPTVPSWAKQSSKPTYTAAEVGALPDSTVIPSKTSDLTNDSGFITSYTDEKVKTAQVNSSTNATYYPVLGTNSLLATTKYYDVSFAYHLTDTDIFLTIGSNNKVGTIKLRTGANATTITTASTGNNTIILPAKTGTVALTSDIPDTSSFLTSESDPIFSASAAANITSTDISNWNAKVSDTGKWNNVSLTKTAVSESSRKVIYVPLIAETSSTTAYLVKAAYGSEIQGGYIARYDADSYLYSTTPSANDNSTKVATTAYVDAAIPDVSNFLTLATLPIYDGTVI